MHPTSLRLQALELHAEGNSISAVSAQLGISRAAIRDWIGDPVRALSRVDCPAPPESTPAYAALFGFYLGDGCISPVRGAYAIRIACDARWPGIIDDVNRCILQVHPERRTYLVHGPGVIVVQSYWKHWPCLFPQHGPGRKHERTLVMTEWQWAIIEDHPADFLRGLFHSDGCRVNNWATRVVAGQKKRYDYPRWQFVNESADIMRWCGEGLDLLDIPWRQTNRRTLSVSRHDAVAELDALIGPKS